MQARICAWRDAGQWRASLLSVTGNYSIQTRLLPGRTEVTGPPPGNSTAANYCNQVIDLQALTLGAAAWFMLAAVAAHENVHAAHFTPGLRSAAVLTPLETAIEALTVPDTGQTEAAAIAAIMALPGWAAALAAARANWATADDVLIAPDHGVPFGTGPSYAAERAVVNPMVTRICTHARANGWPPCPPCPP